MRTMRMKLFLIFVLILATSILTLSLRTKQNSSLSSRLHQEMAALSLVARSESESQHPSHPTGSHFKPVNPAQNESAAPSARMITINNQKYNIAMLDEKDIDTIIQNISAAQLNDIRDTILSPTENALRRHTYLYFLTQIKSAGVRSLFEVVKAEVPKFSLTEDSNNAIDSHRKKLELSLRIAALEALDHLASMDPQVSQYLQQLERSQSAEKATKKMNALLSYLESVR